ncbi:recombinase family protein [Streptomyces sp. NPDC085540]|uniref:recombinase family protein n=1 Tax=Streptomyces sp. NPDC085540 TaxID=3365730 RepID=UPI0037D2EAE8
MVDKRVSTDQQSTARQSLVLDEAGIEDPVVFEEDPGTCCRLHPLQRPKFRALLDHARPGDPVHISEMFRRVRGTAHILDVLDARHRDRLALRIHDGAFSAMDLTARHPRTGELLSTVKFVVQTRAATGELQRDLQGDLQRELTYDGLRAAETKGSKGGRRPAVPSDTTGDVRAAYLEGRSITALAREHDVSRGAIRTAVADLLPQRTIEGQENVPAPELPVGLDVPDKVADFPSLAVTWGRSSRQPVMGVVRVGVLTTRAQMAKTFSLPGLTVSVLVANAHHASPPIGWVEWSRYRSAFELPAITLAPPPVRVSPGGQATEAAALPG